MALLRNGLGIVTNNARRCAGGTIYALPRSIWTGPGALRGIYAGEGTVSGGTSKANKAALPNGYEPPYSWSMAQKGGGFSAYLSITSPVTVTSNLSMGINLAGSIAADGSITTANMQAIANLVSTLTADVAMTATMQAYANLAASMTASGDFGGAMLAYANLLAIMTADGSITSAPLSLVVALTSSMTADGSITSAPLSLLIQCACTMLASADVSGTCVGVAQMASSLAASGDLSGSMSAIAFMVSELSASGSLDGSALRGTLSMSADMTTAGSVDAPPTAAQNAAAVWAYLLDAVSAGDRMLRTSPTATATVEADAGNTSLAFVTDLAETADNHWKDAIASFATGDLAGQVKRVSSYTASTGLLTMASPFTSAPTAGDVLVLVNR